MEIYAVKALGIEEDLFQKLMGLVSPERQARIKRFLRRVDAERCLVADVLIRSIVCRRFGIPNSEIEFGADSYGKPFLKDYSNFYFNLTHSGCWVACAVDSSPIGVDVEEIQTIDFNIAKSYYFSEEYADFIKKPEGDKLEFFFDLWTLKESYMKAAGKGFSIPLQSFCVKIETDGIRLLETRDEFNRCFFKQYDIDKGYKMAVCAANDRFSESVAITTLEGIIENLKI